MSTFRAFYANTISAVRVGDTLTDWFEVASGTDQGAIQAPHLFNIILNWVLEQAMSEKTASLASLGFPEKNVTDIDYVDDLGLLDNNKTGLEESTDAISKHGRKAGLHINIKKTKAMSIDKYTSQQPFPEHVNLNIKSDGEILEQVSFFVYLGSIIACNNSLDLELNKRTVKLQVHLTV